MAIALSCFVMDLPLESGSLSRNFQNNPLAVVLHVG
jgi:hypothetical protein